MASMVPEPEAKAGGPAGDRSGSRAGGRIVLAGYRFDREEMPPEHRRTVDLLVQWIIELLQTRPGARLTLIIRGYTDSVGTESYNTVLGLKRALGVQKALQLVEMPPDVRSRLRYDVSSTGEEQPIASNARAADRAKNRRVEISLKYRPPKTVPAPTPRGEPSLPTLLTPPCIELQKMNFTRMFRRLIDLYSTTTLELRGSDLVLSTDRKKGQTAEMTEGAAQSVVEELIEQPFEGPRIAAAAGPYFAVLEMAKSLATLSQDANNERLARNTNSPEYRRRHRLLVAQNIAKKDGYPNWRGQGYRLLEAWERFERLNYECLKTRGPIRGPEVRPAPPGV